MSAAWHLRSGAIDELVRADDQYEAWATLSDRPASDFGLITTAEPDESGDPIAVRTSALMFWWGREDDAHDFIELAIDAGLPDTTDADRSFAADRREAERG